MPLLLLLAALTIAVFTRDEKETTAQPPDEPAEIAVEDYLAALLINEVPFPGEPAFKSADDSKAAMRAILWTIQCRRAEIPEGYTRQQIAATSSTNLVDIITAFNQMDGFFKTRTDRHTFAPRVAERITYLRLLGQRDDTPTISELLDFAHSNALHYAAGNPLLHPNPFVALTNLPPDAIEVTGSPY
jgi:hypothetical protein